MKKLIIAAAIALTASFSFFTYQSKAVSNVAPKTVTKLTANNEQANFIPVPVNKMDVGQAD